MKKHGTIRRLLWLTALAIVCASGCGRGPLPVLRTGGDFTLTDQDGKPFELSSLRGKAVLIFFGFTSCPDACPTTMSKLASVYRELGPDVAHVQTVYISVDTQRDTPAILKEYLTNFKSVNAIGLTGSVEEIDKVTALFNAIYRIMPLETEDGQKTYTVGHTTSVYALDVNGHTRIIFPYEATVAEMTQGIHDILRTERVAEFPRAQSGDLAAPPVPTTRASGRG
jgi:protein SCO1/2